MLRLHILAFVFTFFVAVASAEPLILEEQFSVFGANQVDNYGSITICVGGDMGEQIGNTYYEPRMTTLGYGGWFDTHDKGRALEIRYKPILPKNLKSTEWFPSSPTGTPAERAGFLDFWDSPDTKDSYCYTPMLKKPIDLSKPGAKIQWDAVSGNSGSIDFGIRIMLRTELGWIVSGRVVAKPKYNIFTIAPANPVYTVYLNSLYDSWVSIMDETPMPDLDGRVNGYTNDTTSLTLGAAVAPNLKYVTGFGFMIDDPTNVTGDLRLDGIRITGETPEVNYGPGTLVEQFSVNQTKVIISRSVQIKDEDDPTTANPRNYMDHHTYETIGVADSNATSMTTTGWGGWMTTDTVKFMTLESSDSTSWIGNEGHNGFMRLSGTGQTTDTCVGTYFYTPRLVRAANLAYEGSKIEWDANADVATTFAMRIIVRTMNDGWLLSDPIVGNLHDRNTKAWSDAEEAPAFSASMAGRTWTWIKNARFNTGNHIQPENPDLDGCMNDGYNNDTYRLILESPVASPDLTNVVAMGLYVSSSMEGLGDLYVDGIRITAGFIGGPPNAAQHWEILD